MVGGIILDYFSPFLEEDRLELLFFSWHTPDKTPLALMIMGNRIC